MRVFFVHHIVNVFVLKVGGCYMHFYNSLIGLEDLSVHCLNFLPVEGIVIKIP